jgi:hypothetical protein
MVFVSCTNTITFLFNIISIHNVCVHLFKIPTTYLLACYSFKWYADICNTFGTCYYVKSQGITFTLNFIKSNSYKYLGGIYAFILVIFLYIHFT